MQRFGAPLSLFVTCCVCIVCQQNDFAKMIQLFVFQHNCCIQEFVPENFAKIHANFNKWHTTFSKLAFDSSGCFLAKQFHCEVERNRLLPICSCCSFCCPCYSFGIAAIVQLSIAIVVVIAALAAASASDTAHTSAVDFCKTLGCEFTGVTVTIVDSLPICNSAVGFIDECMEHPANNSNDADQENHWHGENFICIICITLLEKQAKTL